MQKYWKTVMKFLALAALGFSVAMSLPGMGVPGRVRAEANDSCLPTPEGPVCIGEGVTQTVKAVFLPVVVGGVAPTPTPNTTTK